MEVISTMWRYRIGFTQQELTSALSKPVNLPELFELFVKHDIGFSYDIPARALPALIPQVLGAGYKNPSIMRTDAPHSFSCSSLVSYLYLLAGMSWMPSISVDKFAFGTPIAKEELRFGDLIFTNSGEGRIYYETIEWKKGTPVPEGVDHVGIYMGEDKVLHASRKSGGVAIEDIATAPSFDRIVGYRRIGDIYEYHISVFIPDDRPQLRNSAAFFDWVGSQI
jgi:hypothetical protein